MNKHFIIFTITVMYFSNAIAVAETEKPATPFNITEYLHKLATMSDAEREKLSNDPVQIEQIESILAKHQDAVLLFAHEQRAQQKH